MQTCEVTKAKFEGLNYGKGTCAVTDGKVILNVLTANTCNFACKEGYYHAKGDKNIAFTCASNGGVATAKGKDNWDTMEKCKGV